MKTTMVAMMVVFLGCGGDVGSGNTPSPDCGVGKGTADNGTNNTTDAGSDSTTPMPTGNAKYVWGDPTGWPATKKEEPPCVNQCAKNQKRCAGDTVQTCRSMDSGCYEWVTAKICNSTEVCNSGVCVLNCSNKCLAEARRCDGLYTVQVCLYQANGCTDWTDTQTCKATENCDGGYCKLYCVPQCVMGTKKCDGNVVHKCEIQWSGCSDWSVVEYCDFDEECSNGVCTGLTKK